MYKPLPDFIDIQDSEIDGKGLFAKQIIKENTNIGISHVMIDNPEIWIRSPLGGFVNHSIDNNCILYVKEDWDDYIIYNIITTKKILANEEILLNYEK